jgi:outer membrane protein OmpA-like peptidoglycan-associated protein
MKQEQQFISMLDMMSGLMLIFLLLTVSYMIEIQEENKKIQNIAIAYKDTKVKLNKALKEEFSKDLEKWNAEIFDDNTIRFKNPEVLFESGQSELKEKFKNILKDFFPRYIKILTKKEFINNISEIRIEGHTSSIWKSAKDLNTRYIENARLSQNRAFEVLSYCINIDEVQKKVQWLIKQLRANGLSFAKPIVKNSKESQTLSRRVEFRVITKTEDKIYKIIETFDNLEN